MKSYFTNKYFTSGLTFFSILFFLPINSRNLRNSQVNLTQKKSNKYLTPLKKPVTPQTTIFAFDLHDVLCFKNKISITDRTLKTLSKGMGWYLLNPFFLKKATKIAKEDSIWEDKFYQLTKDYPGLEKFKDDFYNIPNQCDPIPEMISIATKLKSKGYKLFLLSNIGQETYNLFKKSYPKIANLFDGIYLPSKQNNYSHKPNLDFYEKFKNYLKDQNLKNKQIIFIDDLTKNLDAALKLNIAGIHCTSTQNVAKILKELKVNL